MPSSPPQSRPNPQHTQAQEHGEDALLLRTDKTKEHLIFLSQTNGVHPLVSGAAHDVALLLQGIDLLAGPADFSSARNTHVLLHVLRDGRTFAGHQRAAKARLDNGGTIRYNNNNMKMMKMIMENE